MSSPLPHSSNGGRTSRASAATAPTAYSPVDTRKSAKAQGKQPAEPVFVNDFDPAKHGNFISRYIEVGGYPDNVLAGQELQAIESEMKSYRCFAYAVPLPGEQSKIRIRFDNIRDATEAILLLYELSYMVRHITLNEFAMAKFQDKDAIDEYEGQVCLWILHCVNYPHSGHPALSDSDELLDIARRVAEQYGTVRHLVINSSYAGNTAFRVEFHSLDAANRCIHGVPFTSIYQQGLRSQHGTFTWKPEKAEQYTTPARHNSVQLASSQANHQGRALGYAMNDIPFGLELFTRRPPDAHNRVLKERIVSGQDVRTTVMLRNIPNKMDWMALKNLLDTHCFGSYDFLYLRIDFATSSNVGYAFINFVDATSMLGMIDHIEHRTWNGYRSAKAAEISYATIQGKEALIQKFRNSSVMMEASFCRPRLFFSLADAVMYRDVSLIGQEMHFPPPDNPAKLQRSIESARAVGLYPPNGAGATTDHRNRQSNYDRGTPRDQLQSAALASSAPGSIPGPVKAAIQTWFAETYATIVDFEQIPPQYIGEFSKAFPVFAPYTSGYAQGPGVIGQPAQHLIMAPPMAAVTLNRHRGFPQPGVHHRTSLNSQNGANGFASPSQASSASQLAPMLHSAFGPGGSYYRGH